MSTQQMHAWAERLAARRRDERNKQVFATVFLIAFAIAWWSRYGGLYEAIALTLAVIWFAAGQAKQGFTRGTTAPPADAGHRVTISFLREQLQRKQEQLRPMWLGPVALVIAVIISPVVQAIARNPVMLRNAAPFFGLLAVWLLLLIIQQSKKHRELRKELADLSALERQ